MKTITEVRNSFWENHKEFKEWYRVSWKQNDYPCEIRCAFVDFVDMLSKRGAISEKLASKVTL